MWSLQNANLAVTLVGFQKNIAHITVFFFLSKAGAKLDKEEVSGASFNELSKAPEPILYLTWSF